MAAWLALVACVPPALALSACVAIAGKCELSREPTSWRLSCEQAGSAIVVPPSTLQSVVQAASGTPP